MRQRRRLLALLAATTVAIPLAPAHAGYEYVLLDSAFPNPTTLTVCRYLGPRQTWPVDGKSYSALSADWWEAIKVAANIWSDTPGVPVTITTVDECTTRRPSDIIAWSGYEEGKTDRGRYGVWAGSGWCAIVADDHDRVWTNNVCPNKEHAAVVGLNDWYPTGKPGDAVFRWATSVAVHELGHVFGLGHPCNLKCVGPIMSYATCPHSDGSKCTGWVPNADDRAGMRRLYYGSDSSSGGGCTLGVERLLAEPPVSRTTSGMPGLSLRDVTGTIATLKDLAVTAPNGPGVPITFVPAERLAGAGDDIESATAAVWNAIGDPAVDAFATLMATAGKGWKTVEVVMDAAGTRDPFGNCL